MKLIRVSLLFICFNSALAGGYVGASINYLNLDDKYYRYSNNPSVSYNVGYSFNFKPIVITSSTNRLLNLENDREFTAKNNGVMYQSKAKTTLDTIMIGYNVGRLTPSLVFSNARVQRKVYHNSKLIAKSSQTSLICGLNLSYYYDKNFTFYTTLVAPNKEFSVKNGYIFGINYNF